MKKTKAITTREESLTVISTKPSKEKKDDVTVVYAPAKLSKGKLQPRQELFCQLYAGNRAFYGNATRSYITSHNMILEEYVEAPKLGEGVKTGTAEMMMWIEQVRKVDEQNKDIKKRNVAKENVAGVEAWRMLRNPRINDRIDEVRQKFMTDAQVDFELGKVVLQDTDLANKMRGIEQHNKLRGRIIDKSENNEKHFVLGVIKHVYDKKDKKKKRVDIINLIE